MTTFPHPPDRFEREDQATSTQIQRPVPGDDPPTAPHQLRDLIDAYDPEYADSGGDAEQEGDPETRQRRRYGGVNWGAGFFGWMDAVAVAVLLAGALTLAMTLVGGTAAAFPSAASGTRSVGTAAIGAGFTVLLVAYFSGGYVAGRMSRFDGGKQGVGLWVVGLLLTAVAVGALLLGGARLDLSLGVHLPRLVAPAWAHGIGVLVVAATALLSSLLAAMAGGALGCRYHRKVDDVGYVTS